MHSFAMNVGIPLTSMDLTLRVDDFPGRRSSSNTHCWLVSSLIGLANRLSECHKIAVSKITVPTNNRIVSMLATEKSAA